MAAIRLARGYTGKQDIVKVEGGFHGAHDAVLVKAGSGATTLGVPTPQASLPTLLPTPGRFHTTTLRRLKPCSPGTRMLPRS